MSKTSGLLTIAFVYSCNAKTSDLLPSPCKDFPHSMNGTDLVFCLRRVRTSRIEDGTDLREGFATVVNILVQRENEGRGDYIARHDG